MTRLEAVGALTGILAVLAAPPPARAATLCVDPAGRGGCELTIQAAVDRAAAGDTIRIGPGVYYEGVHVRAEMQGAGLYVFCHEINIEAGPGDDVPADCSRASIAFNRLDDAHGISAGSVAPGMVVHDNSLRRTAAGMSIEGSGTIGESVPIRRRAEQRDRRLESNRALENHGSGFAVVARLQSDGSTTSFGNTLEANVAELNAAQGIAILPHAEATAIFGNVALHNRTDFCDEGANTVASGNTFGTTGSCALLR